ncbi:QDE2 protein [Coprinopsis sp. MPI-PUGE-AT-0042]|nr:QDE2 protein [Coprinopsis sp. MPI-PUGE-AT-0042]
MSQRGAHRGTGRGGYGIRGGDPPRGGRGGDPGRGRGGPPQGQGFDGGPRGRGGGPPGGRPAPGIFQENIPAVLPPRLTDSSQDALTQSFAAVPRPLRPQYGTRGTPVTLRSNFFAVRLSKAPIHNYTVEITPKSLGNRKERLFQLLERHPVYQTHAWYVAHDKSARLVSARQLPQPLDFEVVYRDYDDADGSQVYVISVKFDKVLDISDLSRYPSGSTTHKDHDPLPLISALNLVLRQYATRSGAFRVGKSRYFFPTSDLVPALRLRELPGLYMKQGFFVSVRPAFKQLMVNVDACMTAFIEPGNLADRLLQFRRDSNTMPTLSKAMIRSIRVRTLHLKHRKKLNDIGTTSARNTFFFCQEYGGQISVENFFKRKYNIQLRHAADLPLVNLGNKAKPQWIPAELCEIEDNCVYLDKADIVRLASNVNAEAIINAGSNLLGFNSPNNLITQSFGVEVDPSMAVIPARQLQPPGIQYKGSQPMRTRDASWNITQVKFNVGASVRAWWCLVVKEKRRFRDDYNWEGIGGTDPRLSDLVNQLRAKLAQSGMNVPEGPPKLLPIISLDPVAQDPGRRAGLNYIKTGLRSEMAKCTPQTRPSFMLVLLEGRDKYVYPGIKKIGDVDFGILTVHMLFEKVFKDSLEGNKRDQYLSNVSLKINTKLGGVNHLLEDRAMQWLRKKKTMMVGIDVTHPGPGSKDGSPSIAAVVASVDDNFVQFPASMRIQTSKQQMPELRDMFVERLLLYEKKNRCLPERIFVYRDGVSEGQFDQVVGAELRQLKEACTKMAAKERGLKKYAPTLSIIICGFFPTTSQSATRNGNTVPGTVVDRGITGIFDFDFYLQAHAGLIGSVKATHYTVVYDENALTADDIQQGTHDVSYLYARATKAVSLIPAAYYADLACERGRCYLNEFLLSELADMTTVDETAQAGKETGARSALDWKREKEEKDAKVFKDAKAAWGQGLHEFVKDTMFYI